MFVQITYRTGERWTRSFHYLWRSSKQEHSEGSQSDVLLYWTNKTDTWQLLRISWGSWFEWSCLIWPLSSLQKWRCMISITSASWWAYKWHASRRCTFHTIAAEFSSSLICYRNGQNKNTGGQIRHHPMQSILKFVPGFSGVHLLGKTFHSERKHGYPHHYSHVKQIVRHAINRMHAK